jgi:signal transduction histidine kinase
MEKQKLIYQLEDLNQVSQTLRSCSSVEEVAQKALEEVRERLKVQVASIFLLSKDGLLKRFGINGVDRENNPIDNSWFSDEQYAPGESFSGQAIPKFEAESSYGKPVFSNQLLDEYSNMRNRNRYLEKLGQLRCGISVPLNGVSRTFGTIEVLNKQENIFSSEDIYLLIIIGTNVANYIVDFRRKKRLGIYKEMTAMLIDSEFDERNIDLHDFYQTVANKLTEDFTPYKACIIRIADEKDDLEIRGKSSNLDEDVFWQGRKDGSVKAGSQITGTVYTKRKPIFIQEIDDVEIQQFNNKNWIRERQLKSFACLPLSVSDKCVGTISVYTQYPHKFSDNYKSFLENMAFLTAAITARVRLLDDLRRFRQERNEIQERMLNASILIREDRLSRSILHQYKNELLNFFLFLEEIDDKSNISNKERQRLINEQSEWIKTRIEEIQPELEQEDDCVLVDINTVIREVVKSFSFEFSSVDIKIETNLDCKIPNIVVNEREIRDVIFNLLWNAEKAIQKAERKLGKIEITTSMDTTSTIEFIQITVEDNGTGIDNKIRDKIFERRFTTRSEEGGTGLGLFVVRQILNSLGGKIYFESGVKGAKFYVKIPWEPYKK